MIVFKDTVRKEDNVGKEQFLLLPPCFLPYEKQFCLE